MFSLVRFFSELFFTVIPDTCWNLNEYEGEKDIEFKLKQALIYSAFPTPAHYIFGYTIYFERCK